MTDETRDRVGGAGMSEPRTEAGRALLKARASSDILPSILAIETEPRATPAGMSEDRLRAAAIREAIIELQHVRGRLSKVTVEDFEAVLRAAGRP